MDFKYIPIDIEISVPDIANGKIAPNAIQLLKMDEMKSKKADF